MSDYDHLNNIIAMLQTELARVNEALAYYEHMAAEDKVRITALQAELKEARAECERRFDGRANLLEVKLKLAYEIIERGEAELAAQLARVLSILQEARDHIGSMPTIGPDGAGTFFMTQAVLAQTSSAEQASVALGMAAANEMLRKELAEAKANWKVSFIDGLQRELAEAKAALVEMAAKFGADEDTKLAEANRIIDSAGMRAYVNEHENEALRKELAAKERELEGQVLLFRDAVARIAELELRCTREHGALRLRPDFRDGIPYDEE